VSWRDDVQHRRVLENLFGATDLGCDWTHEFRQLLLTKTLTDHDVQKATNKGQSVLKYFAIFARKVATRLVMQMHESQTEWDIPCTLNSSETINAAQPGRTFHVGSIVCHLLEDYCQSLGGNDMEVAYRAVKNEIRNSSVVLRFRLPMHEAPVCLRILLLARGEVVLVTAKMF